MRGKGVRAGRRIGRLALLGGLTAGLLGVGVGYAGTGEQTSALDCPDGEVESIGFLYDGTVEPRSTEQQVTEILASAMFSPVELQSGTTVDMVYEDATQQEFVVQDSFAGQPVATLSFRYTDAIGWELVRVERCP